MRFDLRWIASAALISFTSAVWAGDCSSPPRRGLLCHGHCLPPPQGTVVQSLPILLAGQPLAPTQALPVPQGVTEAQLAQLLKLAQQQTERRNETPVASAAPAKDCCTALEARVGALESRVHNIDQSLQKLTASFDRLTTILENRAAPPQPQGSK